MENIPKLGSPEFEALEEQTGRALLDYILADMKRKEQTMSESGRREIVERVETDKIFIDEVKDTTEGCVIAVSHDWKYKLILTSTGFQWLNLEARTGDLDLASAKEFGSAREATQWWKKENPHIPVYLYPSMKGVL